MSTSTKTLGELTLEAQTLAARLFPNDELMVGASFYAAKDEPYEAHLLGYQSFGKWAGLTMPGTGPTQEAALLDLITELRRYVNER